MKHFSSLMRGWLSAALLMLLLLAGPAARAQAPAWQSAMAMGTNVQAMTTDASGNVYLTGQFDGTITFGATTLTNTNDQYTFIAKWIPATSSFAWAKQLGGSTTAIAVQGGSVYLAGFFGGISATFGSTTLFNTGGYYTDGFVTKLTDSGSSAAFGWTQQVSGFHYDEINGLAVSGTSVYITGYFASRAAAFGSLSLVNNSTSGNDPWDMFVAKLTDAGATGSFVWALKGGGQGFDRAMAVAANGSSIYVAGSFDSSVADFGSIRLTNSGTSNDAYVAKITDLGASATYVWALQPSGSSYEQVNALAVNGTSVYAIGCFYSNTAAFGSHVLTKSTTYSGDSDTFIIKLTDAGTTGSFVWAQRAGDSGGDIADAVAVSGSNVYVSGRFTGTSAQFGSIILTTPPSGGHWNVFVCELTDAGPTSAFDWAQQAGGFYNDYGNAVAISGRTVYMGGNVELQGTFGNLTVGNGSSFAGYFASLTDPTLLATTAAQSSLPFTLAPNPARASTTVQLPALPGTTTATLTLRDALGRALRTETVSLPPAGLRHEFDLTGLPAGIYVLQVRAGAATATRRLVVE